jgi:hypothetical protein
MSDNESLLRRMLARLREHTRAGNQPRCEQLLQRQRAPDPPRIVRNAYDEESDENNDSE